MTYYVIYKLELTKLLKFFTESVSNESFNFIYFLLLYELTIQMNIEMYRNVISKL